MLIDNGTLSWLLEYMFEIKRKSLRVLDAGKRGKNGGKTTINNSITDHFT